MGFFSRKTESLSVDMLLSLPDSDIDRMLKKRKDVPYRNAKELRDSAKRDRRRVEGEKGLGAIRAALAGGGTGNRNYQNVPLSERMHPAAYKALLRKEAKRQGLI